MSFHSTDHVTPADHVENHPTRVTHPGDGESGGSGVHYPTEDIHATGKGIEGTATRIKAVSDSVGEVHIGSDSFGALNAGFAATTQEHVAKTQEAVATTSEHVSAASEATHTTASSYENTEAVNTGRFTGIEDGTGSGSTTPAEDSTTPSSAGDSTTPSATAPVAAPRDPAGAAPAEDSTTPSSAEPVAAPPGGPPGGPGGGSSGPPDEPTPGGGTPSRDSWRQTIAKNFTPDEQTQINDALHKMTQPPKPGEVAGSGQLSPTQRGLIARVQRLVTIEPDTPMQKVLPAGSAEDYLTNKVRTTAVDHYDFDPGQVGGFVGRQQDATDLHTPTDMINGNRLDYPGTRFAVGDPNAPIYVMKFGADDPNRYQTPLGAPFENGPGMLPATDPAVTGTATDMVAKANDAGIDPKAYQQQINQWPYSGIGVTAHETLGLPERVMSPGAVPDGAEMWRYDSSGTPTLVGTYDEAHGSWTDLRPKPTTP